ncbi:hypothetical protein D9758_010144 [Tetrapyrgos nigripes]|uniref:Uncharacterized protein n=1 Tax=Tetrapyrgos nigripes TaxID=182062 RepID=A0A8H5FSD0_9AGAR|nr:hypothetical protein D9758_010144 [Tetrapyrgos nigripes]
MSNTGNMNNQSTPITQYAKSLLPRKGQNISLDRMNTIEEAWVIVDEVFQARNILLNGLPQSPPQQQRAQGSDVPDSVKLSDSSNSLQLGDYVTLPPHPAVINSGLHSSSCCSLGFGHGQGLPSPSAIPTLPPISTPPPTYRSHFASNSFSTAQRLHLPCPGKSASYGPSQMTLGQPLFPGYSLYSVSQKKIEFISTPGSKTKEKNKNDPLLPISVADCDQEKEARTSKPDSDPHRRIIPSFLIDFLPFIFLFFKFNASNIPFADQLLNHPMDKRHSFVLYIHAENPVYIRNHHLRSPSLSQFLVSRLSDMDSSTHSQQSTPPTPSIHGIWAMLSLAFVIFTVSAVLLYAMYSCYHSAAPNAMHRQSRAHLRWNQAHAQRRLKEKERMKMISKTKARKLKVKSKLSLSRPDTADSDLLPFNRISSTEKGQTGDFLVNGDNSSMEFLDIMVHDQRAQDFAPDYRFSIGNSSYSLSDYSCSGITSPPLAVVYSGPHSPSTLYQDYNNAYILSTPFSSSPISPPPPSYQYQDSPRVTPTLAAPATFLSAPGRPESPAISRAFDSHNIPYVTSKNRLDENRMSSKLGPVRGSFSFENYFNTSSGGSSPIHPQPQPQLHVEVQRQQVQTKAQTQTQARPLTDKSNFMVQSSFGFNYTNITSQQKAKKMELEFKPKSTQPSFTLKKAGEKENLPRSGSVSGFSPSPNKRHSGCKACHSHGESHGSELESSPSTTNTSNHFRLLSEATAQARACRLSNASSRTRTPSPSPSPAKGHGSPTGSVTTPCKSTGKKLTLSESQSHSLPSSLSPNAKYQRSHSQRQLPLPSPTPSPRARSRPSPTCKPVPTSPCSPSVLIPSRRQSFFVVKDAMETSRLPTHTSTRVRLQKDSDRMKMVVEDGKDNGKGKEMEKETAAQAYVRQVRSGL